MKKTINGLSRGVALAGAAVSAAFFSAASMAAPGDLAASVTGELTDGKAEILLVGGAVLLLCGVVLLISMVKRSTKG